MLLKAHRSGRSNGFPLIMEITLRCKKNHIHDALDRHGKKCKTCSSPLERLCIQCNIFVSYSNFKVHKCVGEVAAGQAPLHPLIRPVECRKLRFAVLGSGWALDKGDPSKYSVLPMGEYKEHLPDGFPKELFRFIKHSTKDDPDTILDVYDAVWGQVSMDKDYHLVCVYNSLPDLLLAMKERTIPSDLDFLFVGEWIHPTVYSTESFTAVQELFTNLCNLEVESGLRIFPPPEYCWFFARKAHYYRRLQFLLPFSLSVRVIPTVVVSKDHNWKGLIREFAKKHRAKQIVFKRELSDLKRHHSVMDVKSLGALENRSQFNWLAQPFIPEFGHHFEMRMYVLQGKCTFGVMTKFSSHDGSISLTCTAPGRKNWDEPRGGREAALIAENIVDAIRRDQAGAGHFLRVDLVRRDDSEENQWWLNELEFFGNASLMLEAFDNADDQLNDVVTCVKLWIRDLIRN